MANDVSERKASIVRTTDRAEVRVALDLDGNGVASAETEIPFLDRMLVLFSRHGAFDLDVQCQAGTADSQDLMEEIGLCLGMAFDKALGEKTDILRSGCCFTPVEDRLARVVVEVAGHPGLVYRVQASAVHPEGADSQDVERFWRAFVDQARLNMHVELLYGGGGLPAFEAVFKAAARALRDACCSQAPRQGSQSTAAIAAKKKRKLR